MAATFAELLNARSALLKTMRNGAFFFYQDEAEERASYLKQRAHLLNLLEEAQTEDWHAVCNTSVESGSYSVVVSFGADKYRRRRHVEEGAPLVIACHAGVLPSVAVELARRIEHVGPETILEGVSLDTAIGAKEDFTRLARLAVKLKEGRIPTQGRRESIPERVRREVWRRDGGRCVDCGSRERLEYDHIIAVSRGGANTARNIELRCETCNRRKAAAI